MTFENFKLHPRIMAGVQALGYLTPTPIQRDAIPPILLGRDVMGLAQTGTGKTAAFVLPILQNLILNPRAVATSSGRLRALIVAPTRELSEQIYDSIVELGQKTGFRAATIYGGVGINPQYQKLDAGIEIAVACPGRLLDHIGQGTVNLSHLEVLVLDEADQMFDMGFLPAIRQILKHVPAKRQTLLFSATMPDDIRRLAHEILHDPVTIQIGHSAPAVTVSHAIYPVEPHLKTKLLLELLKHTDTESVLVFTCTKYRAKRVAQQLSALGYKATELQGNLSQTRREAALDGFRDGTFQILVATDIAARGIDVSRISHVINYDMPDTADAYTHRIGRTGRAAKTGDAYTLVTREDEIMVRAIERVLKSELERRQMPGFDYNVPRPARDAEFARPPREPQRRKPAPDAGGHGSHRTSSSQSGSGGRPVAAPSRPSHPQQPGNGQGQRRRPRPGGFGSARPSGNR